MSRLSHEELAEKLAAHCTQHFGEGTTLEGLRRLTGGASQETWSFDVAKKTGESLPLILRKDTAAAANGIPRKTEYELLNACNDAGVAVPALYFFIDKADGLGPAYVMARMEGETIPRKILRDDPYKEALPKIATQCGKILASIHAVPLPKLPALPTPPKDVPPGKSALSLQRMLLDSLGEPHPAFELGLQWLEAHVPQAGRVTLVHGDFRNGNLMIGPDGVRAVLDWELAHVGDPMEDLGWFCVKSWRFGENRKPAGGFGSREELFEAYEKASGFAVDPEVVRFWEVYGNLKWGLICELQASFHLKKLRRSVELAALGRRVCEMEHDLLEMID